MENQDQPVVIKLLSGEAVDSGCLQENVMQQLENEKKMLLDRKRREQEERRRKQDELERILQENRQKVTRGWSLSLCL